MSERKWTAEGIASLHGVQDDDGTILFRGSAAQLREIVLACPEAAKLLTEPPLLHRRWEGRDKYKPDPRTWNGFVPPRLWGGRGPLFPRNASVRRDAYLAVVKIALQQQ